MADEDDAYLSYVVGSVKKKHGRHRHRPGWGDTERSAMEIVTRVNSEQTHKDPPTTHRKEE